MIELLRRIYQTGQVEDADGNPVTCFPTSVPAATAELLAARVEHENHRRTLEIGMAHGLSTLAICGAHAARGEGSHTAIDPFQADYRSIGLLNVRRAGLEQYLRFYPEASEIVLPRLVAARERFDLAFIDGMHLFDYVLTDFFYVDRLLEIGGEVVFDDLWMPAIRRVVSFALTNRAYELVRLPPLSGNSLVRQSVRTVRRWSQDPFERTPAPVRFSARNICILRKTGEDTREARFYRRF